MRLVAEWWVLVQHELEDYDRGRLLRDVLAGLTVAAVALPLALAFGVAFESALAPLEGLDEVGRLE